MKKEKKSSIFWILIIFFVLFSIWQLWVPEALDDWRWGSEVGIMRLKTWFEGYNGRYFGDILVIVLTRLPIVLRSMAISGIMTAMLYLIYQLTEYKILSFLICVFLTCSEGLSADEESDKKMDYRSCSYCGCGIFNHWRGGVQAPGKCAQLSDEK